MSRCCCCSSDRSEKPVYIYTYSGRAYSEISSKTDSRMFPLIRKEENGALEIHQNFNAACISKISGKMRSIHICLYVFPLLFIHLCYCAEFFSCIYTYIVCISFSSHLPLSITRRIAIVHIHTHTYILYSIKFCKYHKQDTRLNVNIEFKRYI